MGASEGAALGGIIGILIAAVVGLVIGVIAKLLMPGKDPGGWFMTILLGIAGSWVGGVLLSPVSPRSRSHRGLLHLHGALLPSDPPRPLSSVQPDILGDLGGIPATRDHLPVGHGPDLQYRIFRHTALRLLGHAATHHPRERHEATPT